MATIQLHWAIRISEIKLIIKKYPFHVHRGCHVYELQYLFSGQGYFPKSKKKHRQGRMNHIPLKNQVSEENKYKEVLDGSATIFWKSTMPCFHVYFWPFQWHHSVDCSQPLSCQIQQHTVLSEILTAQLTCPSEELLSMLEAFHAMFLEFPNFHL